MKKWLLSIGIFQATSVVVVGATLISLVIATTIIVITGGNVSMTSILASTITPVITAGIFGTLILRLLYDLDHAERLNKKLASTDELTGLHNRRAFMQVAERELSLAKRYGTEFTLMLLDVDDLKAINDTHGHLMGDRMLKAISEALSGVIRETDVFARLGGDEFVVLVSQSGQLNIDEYIRRLHRGLQNHHFLREADQPITISIGAQRYDPNISSIDELLHLADQEMYESKAKAFTKKKQLPSTTGE